MGSLINLSSRRELTQHKYSGWVRSLRDDKFGSDPVNEKRKVVVLPPCRQALINKKFLNILF